MSRLRLVGMGVAVAALGALVPAQADAASTYVHSASSGTFASGRLTLRGVGRNVKWFTAKGRHGVAPVRFAQKRVFLHGMHPTGVLRIAGRRGGEKFAFRLSDPRYSKTRRTASYRATRLTERAAAARVAAAVPRRFGRASLSVTPTVSSGLGSSKGGSRGLGDSGNDCVYILEDDARASPYLYNKSADKWDTDDWAPAPPERINLFSQAFVGTAGGLWRGCHNKTVWINYTGGPTITIDFSWPWTQGPSTTCTVSDPNAYACGRDDRGGEVIWKVTSR